MREFLWGVAGVFYLFRYIIGGTLAGIMVILIINGTLWLILVF